MIVRDLPISAGVNSPVTCQKYTLVLAAGFRQLLQPADIAACSGHMRKRPPVVSLLVVEPRLELLRWSMRGVGFQRAFAARDADGPQR